MSDDLTARLRRTPAYREAVVAAEEEARQEPEPVTAAEFMVALRSGRDA